MANLLESLIQVHGKTPVSNLMEQQDDNRDVVLADSNILQISKGLKNSSINIYNPRNVNIGGVGTGSLDHTTESEKREDELEKRRKAKSFLPSAGIAGSFRMGGPDGGDGGGGDETDDGGGGGGLMGLLKRALPFLAGAGAVTTGAGLVKGVKSFRPSGVATKGQKSFMKRTFGRPAATSTPAQRGSVLKGEKLRKGFTQRSMGKGRMRFFDSAGKMVKKGDAVRGASKTLKILKGAGGISLRGAGMLKNLAGGPIGIAALAIEQGAQIYLDRLNESNQANAIKNASYPIRNGNTLSTTDGTELFTLPDDLPQAERAMMVERANLIQNATTILGLSQEARDAFKEGRDTDGKIAADAIPLLMEERSGMAARMAGVMVAEGYISDISEGKRFMSLSPGKVGQGDAAIDYNDIGVGKDQEVKSNLEAARSAQYSTEVVDNASIEAAGKSVGNIKGMDHDKFEDTANRRKRNYENARTAQTAGSASQSMVVPPNGIEAALNNLQSGQSMMSDMDPASKTFGQTIIVSPPNAIPSKSEDEIVQNLETRPSSTRELREQAGTSPSFSGPMTGMPI